MEVSPRVRAHYAMTRWLIGSGVIREVAPSFDRAVNRIVGKIGKATRTQEKITVGRIKKEITAMNPESPASVDTAVEKIRAHIIEHGEVVAPMAAIETARGTDEFYFRVKEGWSKQLDVPMTWAQADEEARKIITQWDHTFIGNHYRDAVTQKAEGIIRDTIEEAEGSMSRKEIAARLKTEMADVVKPKNYWEVVAAHDIAVARSWSSARFLHDAGIPKYQVVAVGDDRTCPICQFMDGQILEVERTLENFADYKDAETADDAKEVSGWLTTGKDEEGYVSIYSGEDQLAPDMTGEDLQTMGVNAPDYHALCRCTVVAVFE
jgi:SPP1 gp7 family putative phage head morphogenesis protein